MTAQAQIYPLDVPDTEVALHPGGVDVLAQHIRDGALDLEPEKLLAPRSQPDWVLAGLPRGNVGLVVAPGGTGKTWLAVQISLGVARGTGWPWPVAQPPGDVLYLGAEEDLETLGDRAKAIFQANRISDSEIQGLKNRLRIVSLTTFAEATLMEGNHPGDLLRALHQELEVGRYRLIVLDPLASLSGLDSEENTRLTRLVKHLRVLAQMKQTAILVSHHTSQWAIQGGEVAQLSQTASRGGTALSDGVRWQANLIRPGAELEQHLGLDEARRYRRLVVVKANHVEDGAEVWLRFGGEGALSVVDGPPLPAGRPAGVPKRTARTPRRSM